MLPRFLTFFRGYPCTCIDTQAVAESQAKTPEPTAAVARKMSIVQRPRPALIVAN